MTVPHVLQLAPLPLPGKAIQAILDIDELSVEARLMLIAKEYYIPLNRLGVFLGAREISGGEEEEPEEGQSPEPEKKSPKKRQKQKKRLHRKKDPRDWLQDNTLGDDGEAKLIVAPRSKKQNKEKIRGSRDVFISGFVT